MTEKETLKLMSASGGTCLSVIVPVSPLSPERQMNVPILRNELELLETVVKKIQLPAGLAESLVAKVENAVAAIDLNHCKQGLGIYVSDSIESVVHFPFPVEQKILVGNSFGKRDLLYYLDFVFPSYLLSVGKRDIRLFKFTPEAFTELHEGEFPICYEELYEYSRPSRANSFSSSVSKNFEREKSELQEIRITDLLRKADHSLKSLINSRAHLFIAGNKREVHDFLEVTGHKKQVTGKIYGNYSHNGCTQLAILAKEELFRFRSETVGRLLLELRELIGKKMVAVGITEVWDAATSGNCLRLILEKDFECHGYVHKETGELKMHNPVGKSEYVFTGNLVEMVIEKVLRKGGKVTFAENGQLGNFDHIALQLRYPG